MKGILFKTWQAKLQALQEFSEAQTRRAESSLREINKEPDKWICMGRDPEVGFENYFMFRATPEVDLIKPRYQEGEIAYVKEAWKVDKKYDNLQPRDLPSGLPLVYPFGGDPADEISIPDCYGRLRSPLHLREEDARHFIKILDNSAERLRLPLSPEELKLEGGEAALPLLEKINGLWVFRYEFEYLKEGR